MSASAQTLFCAEITGEIADKMRVRQKPGIYPELHALYGTDRVVLPAFFAEH